MFFLPLALEHHLCPEIRSAGDDHQARNAIERRRHPIGIELVAHHGHFPALHLHPAAGHSQRKGQGLGAAVEVGKAQLFRKGTHPLFGTVGNDGQLYARPAHGFQPPGHFFRQLLTAVGGQGVVDVQHQRPDALLGQPLRRDMGNVLKNIFGGN